MILLVFDVTDYDTFQNCKEWLKNIKKFAPESIAIYAACINCDLVKNSVVDKEVIDDYFSHFSPPIPCFEVSTRTGQGFEELLNSAVRTCLSSVEGSPQNDNEEIERSKPKGGEDKNCIIC